MKIDDIEISASCEPTDQAVSMCPGLGSALAG